MRTAGAGPILYRLAGPKPELRAAAPNDQIGMGFIGVGIRGSGNLDTFKVMPGVRPIMAADCYDGHLAWAKEATDGKIETTRDYHAVARPQRHRCGGDLHARTIGTRGWSWTRWPRASTSTSRSR